MVSLMSRPLHSHGNSPGHPLNRRLVGTQSRSGRFGEKQNLLSLSEFEPSVVQSVAKSLSRFGYQCSYDYPSNMIALVTRVVSVSWLRLCEHARRVSFCGNFLFCY